MLALILPPLAASAQSYTFSTVQVEGNVLADDATVAGFARIPRGQTIGIGELNAAFQRVVNSGLFEDVEFTPRGNTLVITVREFPIINVIAIEGNRRIDDDILLGVIGSQPRRVFSPTEAERDAQAIADVYRARGRFAAEVTPRIIERGPARVDLVFEVREGSVVEVERLSFVGNRAFSDARLRRVLDTKQAGLLRTFVQRDTFAEERVALDRALLRDFYLARGFIDFEVLSVTSEISREGDAFFLTFTIREGQQYRVGNVTASSEIDGVSAADVQAQVRLRSGVVFSPTVVESNIARIETWASREGLRFARVDPRITRNDRDRTVDVDFVLVTGDRIFVERIDIQGNVTTLDRVIRRQFRISEGDPLNPREIREAAERIRALEYFSDVQVDGRQGSADDQVVVDVNVEETTTGSLGFGISYSRTDNFGGAITFSERNFLGRGQEVGVTVSTTRGTREFTFDFTEPALRDRDLSVGLLTSYRESDVLSWTSFSARQAVISPSLSFPINPDGRLRLRYELRSDDVRDVVDNASAVIAADLGREITSLVGIGYTHDTRRSELTPGFGMLLRLDQDFAGLGGDRRFLRTTALALVERQVLSEEVTLRAEFEGGALAMLSGDSRYLERFDLSDKMRGFRAGGLGPRDLESGSRESLRGNYFMVARFEAEFPLGLPEEYGIAGGLFFDVGSVWGLDNRAGGPQASQGGCPAGRDCTIDDRRSWRAAAGVSVFWDTPIGPLRFNFSRALRRLDTDRTQNFDLTISSRF
jgi:outer membrane protein insertion porin family